MAGPEIIRAAMPEDAGRLNAALRALSEDLGDRHVATDADVLAAGFGPDPAFRAILAEADGNVVGAAVFSPLYSTTIGRPGTYVSDLWVARAARGRGLGERLLAAVRDAARERWGAGYVRLSVYGENDRAVAFYEALGFSARQGEAGMILSGAAFDRLGRTE